MSNSAVSQVQRDLEEQVVFNVPRTITGESDINIHYSLRHDGTPLDWIGIFHSSNTVTGQPLIFYWAPIKPSDPADPNSRTIIIPASHIQSLKSGVYTFVYMSQKKNVLGVSSEFSVQQDSLHTAEARECSPVTSDSWADSLMIMSSDEEWELASASLATHEHSLSDLSDIVVLSTSPSKEAVKRNAQPMNNNILLFERLTENGISSQSDFKAATCVQEHAINESIIEHNDILETNLDPDQCGKDCTELRKVKRKRNKPNKKCMSLSEELTNKHQAAHSQVVDTKVTKKLKKKKKKCGKFQRKTSPLNNELDVSNKLCDSSESPTLNNPSPKTSKNELHTQVRVDECKSFIENSPHATITNNQKTESIKENTGKTKADKSIKTGETKVSSAQTIEQQINVTNTFQVPKDKNARKILHAKRRSTLIQTALKTCHVETALKTCHVETALKTCHVENINQQLGFSDKLYTTLPKGISHVVSEIYKSEFCDPMVKTEAVSILNENKILKAKQSKTELEPNNIECAGQQSEVLYIHSCSPKLITPVCKDESCWSNTEIKAIARVPRDNRKILKAKSKKNLSPMVLEPYKIECVNQRSTSDEVQSCEPKRLLEAMPLFPKEKIEPTATDVKSTSVAYAHKIPKLTPVGVKVNHVFFPTLPHETDVRKNSNHLSQPIQQLKHSELRSVTEVKSNQNVELTNLQKDFATLNASLNLQTKVSEILLQTTKTSLDSEIAYFEDTSDLGFPLLPTRANISAMRRKGRETTEDNILESAESKTSCPNSMSDSTYTSTTSQPYQSVFQSLYKIKRKLIQKKAKQLRNRKVCQSDVYDCISSTMKRLQNGVGHTSTKSKSTLQPRPDGDENVFKLTQRECAGNILNTSLKEHFNKMIAYTKCKSVKNESLESEQISTSREGRQPTKTALSYASVVKMTKRNCTPSRDTDRLCRDTHKLNSVVTKTKANKSDKMLTPLCADENTGNQPITEEKIGLAKVECLFDNINIKCPETSAVKYSVADIVTFPIDAVNTTCSIDRDRIICPTGLSKLTCPIDLDTTKITNPFTSDIIKHKRTLTKSGALKKMARIIRRRACFAGLCNNRLTYAEQVRFAELATNIHAGYNSRVDDSSIATDIYAHERPATRIHNSRQFSATNKSDVITRTKEEQNRTTPRSVGLLIDTMLRWPYPTPTPIHCAKKHRFKKAKAEHYFVTKLASSKIKGNLMKTARIHSELLVLKRQIKNIFQEIESLRQQIYMYKVLLHGDPRWRHEGYNAQLASSSSLPYETSTRTTCHTSPKEIMTSGYIYELDKVLRDVKTSELCDKCLYRTKAPPRCLCTKSYCAHTNRTDQVEDQMHQDFMNFENQMCTNNDTITKVYRGLNSTENETYNSINTTGNHMYSDLNNLENQMHSKIKNSGNILYTCLNKKLNPLYNSVSLGNQLNNTGNYNNIEKQMSVIDSNNQMPTYVKDAPNQSYSGGKGNQSSLDIKYGDYRTADIIDNKLCVNSRDYSITCNPLKQSAIYSQTNNLKNILTQCHDSPFCSPCCSSDNGLNNAKKTATHPMSSHDSSVPLIQYMRQSVSLKHSETSGLDVQSNHVTTCRNRKPGTLNQNNIHDHCHQFHSGFMNKLVNGDRKKIEFSSFSRVEGGQYYNPYLKPNKIYSSPVNYNQSSVNDLKLGLPGSYIQTNKESSVTSSEKLNCCTTIPSFNWHIEALAAKKMTKF